MIDKFKEIFILFCSFGQCLTDKLVVCCIRSTLLFFFPWFCILKMSSDLLPRVYVVCGKVTFSVFPQGRGSSPIASWDMTPPFTLGFDTLLQDTRTPPPLKSVLEDTPPPFQYCAHTGKRVVGRRLEGFLVLFFHIIDCVVWDGYQSYNWNFSRCV